MKIEKAIATIKDEDAKITIERELKSLNDLNSGIRSELSKGISEMNIKTDRIIKLRDIISKFTDKLEELAYFKSKIMDLVKSKNIEASDIENIEKLVKDKKWLELAEEIELEFQK